MRRFWQAVWVGLAVLSGMVGGVALTYLTLIVPRSIELQRVRPMSSMMMKLNVEQIVRGAFATESWEFTMDDLNASSGAWSGSAGRVVRARAQVPSAQQEVALSAMTAGIQTRLGPSGYITSVSSDSSRGDGDLYWRNSMNYLIGTHVGEVEVIGLGQGDRLVVLILIHER